MPMKNFAVEAIAIGLLVASSALATPITLPTAPLFVQFTDAEQVSNSNSLVGAGGAPIGNRGIVEISTIVLGTALSPIGSDIQGGGGNVFVNGFGPQILGVFQDHVTSPGKSDTGFLDLYWWDSNSQNVGTELSSAANLTKFNVTSDAYANFSCTAVAGQSSAGCVFLGRFDFTTGADPGFPAVSIISPVDPASVG